MTVEGIASNPAATFQYFLDFQNSLKSSHELALDKAQKDYAIAFEKLRKDHTIALHKPQNSYAVALHQVNYNVEQYCSKLRAEMEYLRSGLRRVADSPTFLENLNRERSQRGLGLSPAPVTSRPITQESTASGQMMGVQMPRSRQGGRRQKAGGRWQGNWSKLKVFLYVSRPSNLSNYIPFFLPGPDRKTSRRDRSQLKTLSLPPE